MCVTTTRSGLNSAIRNGYREKKVSVSGVVVGRGIPIPESVTLLRFGPLIAAWSAMHDIAGFL